LFQKEKDSPKKDFFRAKLILDVNLDVKIGGGGERQWT
jgi:hypothetical protein